MSQTHRALRPLWHLVPSGYSVPFIALGAAWMLLFGSCTGVLTAADLANGKAVSESLAGSGLVLGLLLLPVSALLFFVAALTAGKWAARAALFAAVGVTLVLGLLVALVTAALSADPVGDTALFVAVYAVPLGVVALALLVSGGLAVRDVRASVAQARRERVVELLVARGEVDFATVAQEIRLPRERVAGYLDGFVRDGTDAVLDAGAGMVFSRPRYAQKERDLVSVAWGRGKASLTELARELRLSPERLHALLVAAMEAGTFTGFVDARSGEVCSAAARDLRHGRTCPSCGGQMDLAGHGVVVCGFCRAEVFLPAAGPVG